MSGRVEVEVVGVGAFIAPATGGRRRPYTKGDVVEVDAEVAENLIAAGVARVAGEEEEVVEDDGSASSDDASGDSGEGSGDGSGDDNGSTPLQFNPTDLSIAKMLEFAEENDLDLPEDLDTEHRAPVIEAIEAAIEEQEEE